MKISVFLLIFFILFLGFRYAYVPYQVKKHAHWQPFSTLQTPSSPNFYLICKKSYRESSKSPVFNVPVTVLENNWLKMMQMQTNLYLLKSDQEKHQYLFVAYSKFWRFPDLIQLEFIQKDAKQSEVCVYSYAIMGYSDFGVNRKRVENWFNKMKSHDF